MALEVRFSVPRVGQELRFTIFEDRNGQIFLIGETEQLDIRFPLTNDNGLLKLQGANPFEEPLE
ncbi:MAG: hypothetical protein ACTHNW_17555, partial [Mucilaginibacter sp.]